MIRKKIILLALSASCLNVWAADSGMPFLGRDDVTGSLPYDFTPLGLPTLSTDAARTSPVEDSAAAAATSSTASTTSTPSSSLAAAIRGLEELSPLDLVVASITRGDALLAEDAKKLLGLLTPEELSAVEDILPHARYFVSSSIGVSMYEVMEPELYSALPRKEMYPQFVYNLRSIVSDVLSIRKRGRLNQTHFSSVAVSMTLRNYVDAIKLAFPSTKNLNYHVISEVLDLFVYYPVTARDILPQVREILLNSSSADSSSDYGLQHGDIQCMLEAVKVRSALNPTLWRWPETVEGYKEAFKELREFVRPRD